MSLRDWLAHGLVTEHETSPAEIADLLAAARRDLHDCRAAGLSADWRLAIAHGAIRLSATAALAASGFRATREAHHYRAIQSREHTIGADRGLLNALDAIRRKRNLGEYGRAGAASDHEADRAVTLATQLHQRVVEWLRKTHPELMALEEPPASDP